MAMTLVSTVTVGSGGAASISFTNIPQTGKDLVIYWSARSNRSSQDDDLRITLNSGGTYSYRFLFGSGTAADTGSGSTGFVGNYDGNTSTSNTFGNASIYISNYRSSSAKTMSSDSVNENNANAAIQMILATSWSGTSAITDITLDSFYSSTFLQHSTASLYIIS